MHPGCSTNRNSSSSILQIMISVLIFLYQAPGKQLELPPKNNDKNKNPNNKPCKKSEPTFNLQSSKVSWKA